MGIRQFKIKIENKTIIANAEEWLEPQVNSVFQVLSEINSQRLINNFTLQMSWLMYRLEEKTEDIFIIKAFDYLNNPFKDTTEDLTLSLWILTEQSVFLRKLNIEPQDLKFNDKVVLAKEVLDSEYIYLHRQSKESKGCWYIGYVEEDKELDTLHVYELIKLRPALIKVLTLPSEYIVVFENNRLDSVLNEKDEIIFEDN